MAIGQLMIDGRRYMVVEESEYSRLLVASAAPQPFGKRTSHRCPNRMPMETYRRSICPRLVGQEIDRPAKGARMVASRTCSESRRADRDDQPAGKRQTHRRSGDGQENRNGVGHAAVSHSHRSESRLTSVTAKKLNGGNGCPSGNRTMPSDSGRSGKRRLNQNNSLRHF